MCPSRCLSIGCPVEVVSAVSDQTRIRRPAHGCTCTGVIGLETHLGLLGRFRQGPGRRRRGGPEAEFTFDLRSARWCSWCRLRWAARGICGVSIDTRVVENVLTRRDGGGHGGCCDGEKANLGLNAGSDQVASWGWSSLLRGRAGDPERCRALSAQLFVEYASERQCWVC